MPRSVNSVASRARRKKILKRTRGNFLSRKNVCWKNLVEGNCGIDFIKGFDEYNLPVKVAGQIKDFNKDEYELNAGLARRSDRFCLYAMAAAADAMKDAGLVSGENVEPERLGVYIGSGIGGMDTFVNQTKVMLEEGVGRISPFFVPMMISNIPLLRI